MGLTVLDASVLIGFLDRKDRHHPGSKDAIREALARRDDLVVPLVAYTEVLVGAIRQQGTRGKPLLDALLASLPARIVDASLDVGVAAAELRAHHSALKLPDAFVLATAVVVGADRVLTADRGWPGIDQVAIELVSPDQA